MKLLIILNANNSRLHKEAVLQHITKAEGQVFVCTYDKAKVYGLKFSDSEIDLDFLGEPIPPMFYILSELQNRRLTGNLARETVEEFAEQHGDLIKLICNKDLQCGVSATTINKVHPHLIPQFKVQLAKEVPLKNLKYPLSAELKYDGVRIVISWDGFKVLFQTRNGKIIHLPRLAKGFKTEFKNELPFILDTEVTLKDGTTLDRTTVSGMINSARAGNPIEETKLMFYAFDYMEYVDFFRAKCIIPFATRRANLMEMITFKSGAMNKFRMPWLQFSKTKIVYNADEAQTLFDKYLAEGQEGLILKPKNHLYTFKRSKDWIKVKAINTCDLQCINTIEGTGKYQGMIGALVCEGEVNGKHIQVNVGTGLTDADRTDHVTEYIGHIIEIKYNDLIQDSVTKNWSLFLPRFVEVRHDK